MTAVESTTLSDPSLVVLYPCMQDVFIKAFSYCAKEAAGVKVSVTGIARFNLQLKQEAEDFQRGVASSRSVVVSPRSRATFPRSGVASPRSVVVSPRKKGAFEDNCKEFEGRYHHYQGMSCKILVVISEVRSAIEFLHFLGKWSQTERDDLKSQAPGLYEEIAKLEEWGSKQVAKLKKSLISLEEVSESMSGELAQSSDLLCKYGSFSGSYQIPPVAFSEEKKMVECIDPCTESFFAQKQEVFNTYISKVGEIKEHLNSKFQCFKNAKNNGGRTDYMHSYQESIAFVKVTELIISFITPKISVENQKFKTEAPAFYKQITRLHEIQKGWVNEMKKELDFAEDLRDKIAALFYRGNR